MLKDKVCVITGASRGIGEAIARKFAANGAKLALIATKETDKTAKIVEDLSKETEVKFYACNINNFEEIEAVSKTILADFGQVDVLVNNAGITRDNLLAAMGKDDIDSVIDVNLKGTIYMTKAFVRSFIRKKHGNIINLSSVVGLMGNAGQTNYSASKAGVVGFTKSVAKEYGPKGVRANAIAPGFIQTDMTGALTDDVIEKYKTLIPLGRMGETEDVANLAFFLASDMSSYITGEVITVDGGMYM